MIRKPHLAALCFALLTFLIEIVETGPIWSSASAADTAVKSAVAPKGTTALEQVRSTIDAVIQIVESLPGDINKTERRAKLRALLDQRFDFDEMSRRSLGPAWGARTPEEQAEFVKLFSELLARTYLSRVEEVRPGMVVFGKEPADAETGDGARVTVKSKIKSKGDTFPLDYKLINQANNWRVYDVVIENIGLVSNYRNEFAGIIRKDDFSGLLKQLRTKIEAKA